MANRKNKQKVAAVRHVRRINLKAVAILTGVLVLGAIVFVPVRRMTDGASRRSAMEQVKASIDAKDVDMALRRLDRYRAAWPGDMEGFELQAKLLADTAQSIDQLIAAANLNDQLLRSKPPGKDPQETRRRLISLYIRHGDAIRQVAEVRSEQGNAAFDVRYRAAVIVGEQLLANGAEKDSTSQRLVAMAYDGVASGGDVEALRQATDHYKLALAIDPTDVYSAERLASFGLEKRNDQAGAEAILDALLKAKPDSVDARIARYRYFTRAKKEDRARAELEAAVKIAPRDTNVLATLASDSLQHRDPAAARRYLDAIIPADQDLMKVRTLRGMLEFAELRPNDAIDQWRRGLTLAGGTDQQLTWQLAFALIQLRRLEEAKPLVKQYERLDSGDRRGMARFLRAMFDFASGHAARTIDGLERVREKVPEAYQSDLQLTLGAAYESLGDMGRAMLAYRRASTAAPDSSRPRREIARLLKQTNPKESLAELNRALASSPNDFDLMLEVGRLLFNTQAALPPDQRRWTELETILGKLTKLLPNNLPAQLLRADYLVATGRLDLASEMLGEATKGAGRKRPEAWVAYANALERQGRRDEALAELEGARQPDVAGDHSLIRIARARLLARAGKGQSARDLLSADLDRVPKPERGDLAKARGDLARELGDRAGARAAYAEWAKLQPDSPSPGLTLMEMAQVADDDDAARLGMEALRAVGGDQEPYGLAARAIDLVRIGRNKPGATVPPEMLEEAERLVTRLEEIAPQLSLGPLIRGLIFERRNQPAEAAASYRKALRDGATVGTTLPRLIDMLVKLGKPDELVLLKQEYGDQDRGPLFDQLMTSSAIKTGDKDQAEASARQLVAATPDIPANRAILATMLADSGKTTEAIALLREGIKLRPDEPASWTNLVAFEAKHGAPGDAARSIEQLRTAYKGERPDLVLARCQRLAGNIAAAGKSYDDAVKAKPDDLGTLLVAVEFNETTGRFAESEAALRRVLKLDPKTPWAARTLAMRVVAKPGEAAWNEAWALVAPGAPGHGDDPEDRLVRYSLLSKSLDAARRAESLPELIRLANDLSPASPVGAEARTRLAQLWLDNNRPADAEQVIAPLADGATPVASGLAIGVEAQARTGLIDAAERRLERLAALEPKSPRTEASRAWVLSGRNKPAEAVAVVEAAAAEMMNGPTGENYALGFRILLDRLGQQAAMVKLDRTISTKYPRLAYLYANDLALQKDHVQALALCRVAADNGSPTEALKVATVMAMARADEPAVLKQVDSLFDSVLPAAPRTTESLIMVATVRHIEGRYDDEYACYRQAMDTNPATYKFENNMAWSLSEGLKKPEEALKLVDDVIRREGRSPAYLDTRGVILTRLGRYDEAILDLDASIAVAPSPATYYHLARAYFKAGKPAEHQKARDLAIKAKFDRKTLDPTDRSDLQEVMGTN